MIFQIVHILSKNIRFKTSILRSDSCDYSDVYIVAKGTIDLWAADANENDNAEKIITLKNNASFFHTYKNSITYL